MAGAGGSPSLIDEIVREGARRMLAEALQAEVEAYIAAHATERDDNGHDPPTTLGPVLTTADFRDLIKACSLKSGPSLSCPSPAVAIKPIENPA